MSEETQQYPKLKHNPNTVAIGGITLFGAGFFIILFASLMLGGLFNDFRNTLIFLLIYSIVAIMTYGFFTENLQRLLTIYSVPSGKVYVDYVREAIPLKEFQKNEKKLIEALPDNLKKQFYKAPLIKCGENCLVVTPLKPIKSKSFRWLGMVEHEIYLATGETEVEDVSQVTETGEPRKIKIFFSELPIEEGQGLIEKSKLIAQINELQNLVAEQVSVEEYSKVVNLFEQTKDALVRLKELSYGIPVEEQLGTKETIKSLLTKGSTWLIIVLSTLLGLLLGMVIH